MTLQLLIIAGPDEGRSFALSDGQTLIIGRGKASDTQIDDQHMSRVHCLVQVEEGKIVLLDADSAAGTLIDGKPITKRELKPGEVFQAGETQFQLQLEEAPEASTLDQKPPMETGLEDKDASLNELVGRTFGDFRLEAVIAEGNTGMVFKARDNKEDRPAALKVLSPQVTASEERRERFVRAMKTMLPIRHKNIVQLYAAGKTGDYCWAAMEYVEGESMTSVIKRIGVDGMLDWREAYRVAVHIGRAIQEAYQHKIIHRNVTPQNILLRHRDQSFLLADLMLAKALEGALSRQVTRPGQLVGDVAYMSPERTREQVDIDCRSDIYGLGATIYAMLTGQPPFAAKSLPELIRKIREEAPLAPRDKQVDVDEGFQQVVMRMIAKQPDNRYQTPMALLRQLEAVAKRHGLSADWADWR